MRTLPPRPVFTIDEALACGWTTSALRNAVAHGRIVRLRRGVYAAAGTDPVLARPIAAALSYPGSTVSHRSALHVTQLPVLGLVPWPELTVAPRAGANLIGVKAYRATLRPHDVCMIDGIRTTSSARTLVDVGRHASTNTAVAALDAALHGGLTAVEEIEDVLVFCRNWPRIQRAKRALELCDPRTESPLESVSRLVLRWLGLPASTPQVEIYESGGQFVARVDFCWPEFGIVGEADGRAKYLTRADLLAEKERQERLEDLGLIVVRWTWDEIVHHPRLVKARIERAIERARLRMRSGLPRRWSFDALTSVAG